MHKPIDIIRPVPYDEHKKESSPFISYCYHITFIILGLVIMILAIWAYSALDAHGNAVEDFQANWMQQPIIDIKTALHDCPTGYQSLIERKWPGTVSGCDCRSAWALTFRSGISTSSCDRNQTRDGCRDVYSVAPVPLAKFYSYKICGLRAGDNFVDAKRPRKEAGGTLK